MIAVLGLYLSVKQSQAIKQSIKIWAVENQYQITSQRRCYLDFGPFDGRDRRQNQVFLLDILNEQGAKRQAWVCCFAPYFEIEQIEFEAVVI
ncbi:hypothetical protein Haur_1022 [Herpetosiphon aurantiacus DSM 785]|uniref:Uncharacterized protein n=1 Tax=Herpetosiphon aurantiacus (strain ATCC 23779 / DSM 785 / 114-95) TaxID=316274 RepID=A9AZC4_HERA2|nr:hypothetical protein Haur_1022 [Herpetosiphon aurantiacus DSM 785]